MVVQRWRLPFPDHPVGQTVLLTTAFVLPSVLPGLFGWINGLLGIPVFLTLRLSKPGQGILILRNSFVLIAVFGLIFQQFLPSLLFSLTLAPVGFSLHLSAKNEKSEVHAGMMACLILGATWIAYWTIAGTLKGFNPYTQLQEFLTKGITENYEAYKSIREVPPDVLVTLDQLMAELKRIVPRVLPGVLACSVIMTIWANLVAGNSLIRKIRQEMALWPRYGYWQLPDQLVWLVIGSGILLLLGDKGVKDTGICLALISCLLYFFQGLAILAYLFEKWKLPGFFRVLLYIVISMQSFGFIILAMLGLIDVWINFRKLHQNNHKQNN